jgi:hypothetical protein
MGLSTAPSGLAVALLAFIAVVMLTAGVLILVAVNLVKFLLT